MKNLIYISLLLLCSCISKPDKINVLIIDGYSNHDWRYTTEVINTMLVTSGFCEVDISTAPTNNSPNYNNWNPDFSKYDVVVQNVNSLGNGNSWPVLVQTNFENYMKNGGGMYVFHSANNSFEEWAEYDKMIGLGWRKADKGVAIEIIDNKMVKIPIGEGKNTSHGARVDLVVNILKEHPINNGFPQKWMTPDIELYTYARGVAEDVEVLSYTFDKKTDKNWPVDWVVEYGKGRVYNSTFGHLWHNERMPKSIQCVGFQTTFLRAIQWLAGNAVTKKIPEIFPSENELSLNTFELVYNEKEGWENMFNGIDLQGWEVKCQNEDNDFNYWKVNQGAIECNSIEHQSKAHLWLMNEKEFDNFELHLKFQLFESAKGNGGIQFRCRWQNSVSVNGSMMNGPQADIQPTEAIRTGLIYDSTTGVSRWIYPSMPDNALEKNDIPKDALNTKLFYADENQDLWNSMEIICEGMKITTFVNGKRVANFNASGILDDEIHKKEHVGTSGKIALQLHHSEKLIVRYKDIMIRKL